MKVLIYHQFCQVRQHTGWKFSTLNLTEQTVFERSLQKKYSPGTLLSLSRDSFSGTFPMCKSAISLQIA